MKITNILFFALSLCYLKSEAEGEKYRALIFQRNFNALTVIPKDFATMVQVFNGCEMACPAKDVKEREFNERYSLYNGALFTYVENSPIGCVRDIKVCDESYKLSMAFSIESGKWEFGYEIFFKKFERREYIAVPYEKYYSLKRFPMKSSLAGDFFNLFKNKKPKPEENEKWLKGNKMGFIWIPTFRIELSQQQFRSVEYEITYGNMDPMLPCQDYSLGKEVFENIDLDLLYSDEIQKNSLQGVILPQASSYAACNPEYTCFKKWLLIPSDQFQFIVSSSSSLICSNLATVPIWSSTIEKIMQKVDKHLYSLYWVGRNFMHITAGVHGVLQLRKKDTLADNISRISFRQVFSRKQKLTKPIFLKTENLTIKVPNIIYKMIKMDWKEVEDKYGVLILIHNDPHYTEKLCDDVTEKLGWQEIRYEVLSSENPNRMPSKFIYVCKITKNILKFLGLPYKKYAQIKELSLTEFPFINEKGNLDHRNINEEISDELERTSKDPNRRLELEKDSYTYYHRPFYFH